MNEQKTKENEKMIGKKVVIRSNDSGVHFGTLLERSGTEVVLKDSRRIWYWDGAASISELSQLGTSKPKCCKFPAAVPMIRIMGVCEIIPCGDVAVKSIEEVPVWTAR